ncbi:hypothetical protein, partial [Streptomyces sp. NPDC052015]|uniref:hypothetical protein n=1 Tax=Streptomyces sp. NPDC052015 TaxID=3154755 RepID=UPI003434D042
MTHDTTPPPTQPGLNRNKLIAIVAGAATVAFAVGGGLALLLKGDGNSDDSKPSVVKAADTATPTPSATKAKPRQTFKLGDTANIDADTKFTATAQTYTDTGIKDTLGLLSAGQKYAVLMVKVCNTGDQLFEVSPYPWSLAYADGARVEAAGMNA